MNKSLTDKILQLWRIAAKRIEKCPTDNIQISAKEMVEKFLSSNEAQKYIGDVKFSYDGVDVDVMTWGTKYQQSAVRASVGQISNFVKDVKIKQLTELNTLYLNEWIRWQKLAYNDQLTLLPNRLFFTELIDENFSEDEPYVALVMDLDNFKTINSELGHDGGDAAIAHFWRIFQKVWTSHNKKFPNNQVIGSRLSGDEFAMALKGDGIMARNIANALQIELENNPMFSKKLWCHYPFTVTIGIAGNMEVGKFPIDMEQKWEWKQIPLFFAKAMKLADMSVEVNPTWSISVCNWVIDTTILDDDIKNSIEVIKNSLRSIKEPSDMTITAEKIITEFANWQGIRWHIRMLEAILKVMEEKHEIMPETHKVISQIMDESRRFKWAIQQLTVNLPEMT
jgi:diguanylate cyclase (GGDEF)-like protein